MDNYGISEIDHYGMASEKRYTISMLLDHYGMACEKRYTISMLLGIPMKTVSIYCRTLNKKRLENIILFQNLINIGPL